MQQPHQQKNAFTTILTAWLIAGTLDISSAFIIYGLRTGKNPLFVCNYIASAVFGQQAFSGGASMIITGLLFHYLIAFIFTVLFFLLYPQIHRFIKSKFIAGILYGLFAWLVMNLLVLPLTLIPPITIHAAKAAEGIVILMLAIGLPIALIVHKYYYGK